MILSHAYFYDYVLHDDDLMVCYLPIYFVVIYDVSLRCICLDLDVLFHVDGLFNTLMYVFINQF